MSDDFEARAREAAGDFQRGSNGLAIYADIYTSFVDGAYWARTEMQAEIERLKTELAEANACALANVRDVPIAQELEQTKDYNKFLSEQLAANASSRSYFENECRKLEHELAAAKGEIVNLKRQNESIEESATLVVTERDELKAELERAKGEIERLTNGK